MTIMLITLAIFLQISQPGTLQARSAPVNIFGTWQGGLLPPGISPFETIQSTTTFRPDGTYTLRVVKPTGTFAGSGTFRVDSEILTLNATGGVASVNSFRASRHETTLTLQPIGQPDSPLILSAFPGDAP